MPTHSLYLTNSIPTFINRILAGATVEGQPVVIETVTIPSAPIFSITTGDKFITLTFQPYDVSEIPLITDYQYSLDNGITFNTMTSIESPYTITGLTNGETYQVKMKALNAEGNGTESATQSAIPSTTASPATITSVTIGDGSALVYFDAPLDNGGKPITNYYISTDNGVSFFYYIFPQTTSPITINNLTNGNTYQIVLQAINDNGFGLSSNSQSVKLVSLTNVGSSVASGDYTYTSFTTTGTNNITFNSGGNIEYLIIGAGGAGGNAHGGGGGAGEVISGSTTVTATTYSITVGVGGISSGTIAGDSSAFSVTAKGGGRGGGGSNGIATAGGSGGGGAGLSVSTVGGGTTKTIGLGNIGGNGTLNTVYMAGGGGGGGGSLTAGSSCLTYSGGNGVPISSGAIGGFGTNAYSSWISSISNLMPTDWKTATSSGVIASGGSGGSWYLAVVNGPPGGAGNGGTNNSVLYGNIPATNAIDYTGSGGGGGSSGGGIGGNGGHGLVVIRCLT